MNNKLTLQEVIDCIGFPQESVMYKSLSVMCKCWYAIQKKEGKSEEESVLYTLDKLTETVLNLEK